MRFVSEIVASVIFVGTFLLPSEASSQIRRGEWEFKPVVTLTDNLYGLLLGGVTNTPSPDPWIPVLEQRMDVQKSIRTPFGHAKVKYWDWGFRNIKAGYRATYMSKVSPFGISFGVSYEKRGLETEMPESYVALGGRKNIYFNRQTINPEVLLRLRFGNYINHRINAILEIGGSYNFAFACKGLSKKTDSVNDGFRGVIGVGIGNTENHFGATLRYEYDFYNWFNDGWSPDGGLTHPYQGFKSHIGSLMVCITRSF